MRKQIVSFVEILFRPANCSVFHSALSGADVRGVNDIAGGDRLRCETLAADVDGAEAKDHVTAGGGPAEAKHGAETGEKQHLVELVAQVNAVRAGEDLVADHASVGVYGHVQEKTVGES